MIIFLAKERQTPLFLSELDHFFFDGIKYPKQSCCSNFEGQYNDNRIQQIDFLGFFFLFHK